MFSILGKIDRVSYPKQQVSGLKDLNQFLFGIFAEHILPKRFIKIRHIGFLAPRFKARNLKSIRKHLKVCPHEVIDYKKIRAFITATRSIDPHLCPKCHKGEMVISPHPPACGSLLSMSRMDIDSARAEISQS